jgi:tRNA nucleotidyltransferase (CCA-adding enzyme)
MLRERLPKNITTLMKEFGETADRLGYHAYLVGGIVRDILLKHENLDVDIVIEGDGIQFAHEFAENRDVRVRSHKKFGTAVLIFPDGFKVDVATARMEYYETPAAPPIVETSSLKMDLLRRDFTINTLALKLNKKEYGTLIDYFGGQKDLKEKVIRVLHNLSFVEDPTRILRAIRFEQRFDFKIGKLTLALIKNAINIDCFKDLSGKRLFVELKLLLMEQRPIEAIERLNELGLLYVISPMIKLTDDLMGILEGIREVISWFNLLYLNEPYDSWKVYWYGLTSSLDKEALKEMAEKLRMDDLENHRILSQQNQMDQILEALFRLKPADHFGAYTLLSQYDTETLLYLMAKARNETIKKVISNYFTKLKGVKVLLKGRELKRMGFEPGPLYRKIFDSLIEARIKGKVSSKEDEIYFVQDRFKKELKSPGPEEK